MSSAQRVGLPVTTAVSGAGRTRFSARAASASLLPLVLITGGSLWAVWLSVRSADDTSRYAGIDLPIVRVALVAAVLAMLLGVVVEGVLLNRWPLTLPAVAAAFLLVLTVSLLVLEEVAASTIPTSFLPTSARRLVVDIYGGLGVWLGATMSILILIGSRVEGGVIGAATALASLMRRLPVKLLSVLVVAATAVGLAAWSRYLPWASGSALDERIEVAGWSIAYIGPGTLVVVVALGIAAGSMLAKPNLWSALLLVLAGWSATFLAAIALLTTSTLARVDLERYLPESIQGQAPEVGPRFGAWLMFGTGCVVTVCGVAIVGWLEGERR